MPDVVISKYDSLEVLFECDDFNFMRKLKDHFTDYKEGFMFAPKYKAGLWDGKISVFNWKHKTLPYGLLLEAIRFIKKEFPNFTISITPDVTRMFKGEEIPFVYDLNINVREYQKDCIESCLKYSKGIIVSSTASGKSLLISYIIKHLFDNNICKKSLIIVPTIQLVSQFYSNLIEYGLTQYTIGRVWSKSKEWDSSIVISTWQSLSKHHEMLSKFDCILCDETHQARAHEIKDILKHATRATYRLGFTGTMPISNLDNWNIKGYLGPIIKEYGPGQLSDLGFISKCNVNIYNIEYKTKFEGTYTEIQDSVFKNPYRLEVIKNIIDKADSNIMLLVGKVEKEGEMLKEYLSKIFTNKEVVFIWGGVPNNEREYWRKEMENRTNIVLIATYQVFSTGVNIPSLKHLILAAPYKSKIRTLQSVGRTLRLHANKPEGSYVYDIVDKTKYFNDYGEKRIRYYSSEGFNIIETEIIEGQPFIS